MKVRSLFVALCASAAVLFSLAGIRVAAQPQAALTGTVSSAAEGNMEGVLVTARRSGSTMATTVVTDSNGRYAFPASRLGPGHYDLTIHATGYDLGAPAGADVASGSASADLKLVPTRDLP